MSPYLTDILAFGAHPDDVELSCGGTIALLASRSYSAAIVDLSKGEMGTRGTPATRLEEAKAAAKVLGVAHRECLELPDGGVAPTDEQVARVVETLRRIRPELVFIPSSDRHPDHAAAAELVLRAIFFAGLAKYEPAFGERWSPREILAYQMRREIDYTFLVDTTDHFEQKLKAIRCYPSQVGISNNDEPTTLVSSPLSLGALEARDAHFGGLIGVRYAEAFRSNGVLSVSDPVAFFRSRPGQDPVLFRRTE